MVESLAGARVAPLRIGGLVLPVPSVLAPMAGYTDAPFRLLCRRHGCGLVLTEVVGAEGILRDSPQTWHYLEAAEAERPVGAQIYGADPGVMAEAALRIEATGRFDLIDINCGCPVPKIISKGAGVALMKRPDRIYEMVRAIRQAVKLPVTAKTRIGLSPEEVNISEVGQAIEEGGASVLFVHARLATARHAGPADWDLLAQVKAGRGIPVVGNGGIDRAEDALRMQAASGVDGVMIGRAAIGNPWIFERLAALWAGQDYADPDDAARRRVLHEHLEHLVAHFDKRNEYRRRGGWSHEGAACAHFRAHLLKYLAGRPGVHDLMRRLESLRSIADVMDAVDCVLEGRGLDLRAATPEAG